MDSEQRELHEERWELLRKIDDITEKPLIALAFVWLLLVILDFTRGLSPLLQTINSIIWALFVLDFVIEFIIAPHKRTYLRRNWLTAVSLVLPAFRLLRLVRGLRVFRLVRAARTVNLLRVITSLNRGLGAIAYTLGKRNIGYLVAFTVIVLFVGAAGMAAFESPDSLREAGHAEAAARGEGLESYGDAVWWTAMILTTLGSQYWPLTAEGRILCFLLSIYAFGVFSYLIATIASLFVGQDRAEREDDGVRDELIALRAQLVALTETMESSRQK